MNKVDEWRSALVARRNLFCGINKVGNTNFLVVRKPQSFNVFYIEPITNHKGEVYAKIYVDPIDNEFDKSYLITEAELLDGNIRSTAAY